MNHFIDDLNIKYYFKNENDFNNIKKPKNLIG